MNRRKKFVEEYQERFAELSRRLDAARTLYSVVRQLKEVGLMTDKEAQRFLKTKLKQLSKVKK